MYDVYGVYCATYREACIVAGCDTPEQLDLEAEYHARVRAIEKQDAMEAAGGPVGFVHSDDYWLDQLYA